MKFNLSPSSISTYMKSQLLFYYQYVMHYSEDTEVVQCYGKSGTCVHEALEFYVENRDKEKTQEYFLKRWDDEHKLDKLPGLNGKPLSKQQYYDCVMYGISLIDTKFQVEKSELQIQFPFRGEIGIKGVVDIIAIVDGVKEVVDWKTSASIDEESPSFRRQVLMYCYLYYKKTGEIINRARIVYLKMKKEKVFDFTDAEVFSFDMFLSDLCEEIEAKGEDVTKYDLGDWSDDIFNAHKKKCRLESSKRDNSGRLMVTRKANRLFFENLPDNLFNFFQHYFSYHQMNYFRTPQYQSGKWDGKIRFYKKNSYPFAFYYKIIELIDAYNAELGTTYFLDVTDERNKNVVDKVYNTIFKESEIELYPYQKDALKVMEDKKLGIVYAGTGCVDSETEFLSENGWKRISNYKDEKVMQYNKDNGEAEFVKPISFIKLKADKFYHLKTKYGINQMLSEEHKVLYVDRMNGRMNTILAKDLYNKHNSLVKGFRNKFITSFIKKGGNKIHSDDELRLIVSIIADATIPYKNHVSFNLKKKNKIKRVLELLDSLNIKRVVSKLKGGYTRIYFNWSKATKEFNDSWYSFPKSDLELISKECLLWDGDGKKRFFTSNKESADFIQFCFNSIGKRANILVKDRRGRIRNLNGVNYNTKSIDYVVNVAGNNLTSISGGAGEKSKINIVKSEDGFKYCFSVPSGFLVLRRGNCVFITGNSGKTLLSAEFIKRTNRRSLFIVNRLELGDQTKDEFEDYLGVEVGLMTEGILDVKHQITVAAIQTMYAILKRKDETTRDLMIYLNNVNCVITDEAQNVGGDATMYGVISDALQNIHYCISLTGTPFRSYRPETLELNSLCGFIIYSKPTEELVKEGYLCPTKCTFLSMPPPPYITEVGQFHADYDSFVVNNDLRNETIIDIVKNNRHKKIIILVNRIFHGEYLMEKIPNSFFICGDTDRKLRKEMYKKFKEEDGMVLISMVKILGAGINIKNLDILIVGSAHKSDVDTGQIVGRLMRKSPGKKFGYLIDFADEVAFKEAARERIKMLMSYGHEINLIHHREWKELIQFE